MRALAATLISAALMIAPPSAALAQDATPADAQGQLTAAQKKCAGKTGAARDNCLTAAQTRAGSTSLGKGQIGYVAPDGFRTPVVSPDGRDLPPNTVQAQGTLQDLNRGKLPSNQPTDVAKAAAAVKAKANN